MDLLNEFSNVPKSVLDKMNRNLYKIPNHPLEILKKKIVAYFNSKIDNLTYYEDLDKVVTIQDNFDNLLIPQTHVSRSKSDTYYVNETHVLRTHTTAHQTQLFRLGVNNFLVCGDVYRRDEVDSCHYNIFHQMEGAALFDANEDIDLEKKLVDLMSGLCECLFPGCEYRVKPDYFPFTNPSFEIEVNYNGKWLEILGCGVIQPEILKSCNKSSKGIAWGLGLERLGMILFDIPDIRYFWMDDSKFLEQFKSGQITKFIPFSPLEPIAKDVSFFVNNEDIDENGNWTKLNQFYEEIRNLSDDWIGDIKCIDKFYNKKISQHSFCFKMIYSPKNYKITNPAEFNSLVNELQTDMVNSLRTLKWIQIRG